MKRLPDILKRTWPTLRAFRQGKRAELKAMVKASYTFQLGCAYLPKRSFQRFNLIRQELENLEVELSAKEWGR